MRRYLLVRGYRLIFVAVGLLASSAFTWLGAIIHLSSKELLRNGSYMVLLAILFIDCFFEYAITPIHEAIGESVFHLSLQTPSYGLIR